MEPTAVPVVAEALAGAPGTVTVRDGVTAAEESESWPVPMAFVALAVKVYAVPLVRPDTSHVSAVVVVQVRCSGALVTVYPVMALPPSDAGADHETVARPSPPAAVTDVGLPGTDTGVMLVACPAAPLPAAFVATTDTEYVVPLIMPVMLQVS
jgi:hypothetical protein